MKIKKLYVISLIGILFGCLTSCSNNDEPKEENKTPYYDNEEPKEENKTPNCLLGFKFEQNMINANEFTSQVSTVAVWAFNKAGDLVWSKTESADKTFSKDYAMPAYLPEGEYDIVTWCGKTTDFFKLLPASLSSLSQLSLSLPLVDKDGTKVCNTELPVTFNGHKEFTVTDNPEQNSITLDLFQATKSIRLNLQGNQNEINAEDFDFYITDTANILEWNLNSKSSQSFEYRPYEIKSESSIGGESITIIVADFTTLCFNAESKATLHISNKNTGELINMPLVPHLLQAKPYEAADWSDKEYLDRKSKYNVMFFVQ
ncbi:MAG: FimB/Mfa2 family fimbrial subunit [Muribaculaceae bacterium]|nr:FimB/Mfa2 family fimbrial subunit [Muribaculaceae bacterium]